MNKIRCKKCGRILVSEKVHDLKFCGCHNNAFVDGREEYQRYGAKELENIEVWNATKKKWETPKNKLLSNTQFQMILKS